MNFASVFGLESAFDARRPENRKHLQANEMRDLLFGQRRSTERKKINTYTSNKNEASGMGEEEFRNECRFGPNVLRYIGFGTAKV